MKTNKKRAREKVCKKRIVAEAPEGGGHVLKLTTCTATTMRSANRKPRVSGNIQTAAINCAERGITLGTSQQPQGGNKKAVGHMVRGGAG